MQCQDPEVHPVRAVLLVLEVLGRGQVPHAIWVVLVDLVACGQLEDGVLEQIEPSLLVAVALAAKAPP